MSYPSRKRYREKYWKDPEKYAQHLEYMRNYYKTEHGKATKKKANDRLIAKNPNYYKDYCKAWRERKKAEKRLKDAKQQ